MTIRRPAKGPNAPVTAEAVAVTEIGVLAALCAVSTAPAADLEQALQAITDAAVAHLGFRTASIATVQVDGSMQTAAVSGDGTPSCEALSAPLQGSDGAMVGVLTVGEPREGCTPPAHCPELLGVLAAQAANVVATAQLRASLEASVQTARASEERLRRLFDDSPVGKAMTDESGRLVEVNASFARMLAVRAEDLLGRPYLTLTHADDWTATEHAMRRVRVDEAPVRLSTRLIRPDGSLRWADVTMTPSGSGTGTRTVLLQVEDITERVTSVQALEQHSRSDPLTRLANRFALTRALASLQPAAGPDTPAALVVVDLDHFARVNEGHGRAGGDVVLVATAETLRAVRSRHREVVEVARLGADEFAVLVAPCTEAQAASLADEILAQISAPVHFLGGGLVVTASAGVAVAREACTWPEQLLGDADAAMHLAKNRGGDRWEAFAPSMRVQAQSRAELEADLRTAMLDGGVVVHYQPVVDLDSGSLVGSRRSSGWTRPRGGSSCPASSSPSPSTRGSSSPSAPTFSRRRANRSPSGRARTAAHSSSRSTSPPAKRLGPGSPTSCSPPWSAPACRRTGSPWSSPSPRCSRRPPRRSASSAGCAPLASGSASTTSARATPR